MEQYERNILQHIEEHGCSVTSVFDPDGKEPPFSYSIGIARSSGCTTSSEPTTSATRFRKR